MSAWEWFQLFAIEIPQIDASRNRPTHVKFKSYVGAKIEQSRAFIGYYVTELHWRRMGVSSCLYRVAQKIGTVSLYALTSSNINQFSKLFHCQNQEKFL